MVMLILFFLNDAMVSCNAPTLSCTAYIMEVLSFPVRGGYFLPMTRKRVTFSLES